MSDLVKTGDEIQEYLNELRVKRAKGKLPGVDIQNLEFLVLPQGLDTLEEMLKKEIEMEIDRRSSIGYSSSGLDFAIKTVDSVFARFKQEHGIKEE